MVSSLEQRCDLRSGDGRPDPQALAVPFIETRHRRLALHEMGNPPALSRAEFEKCNRPDRDERQMNDQFGMHSAAAC
jgi:hypothetical protein